MNLKKSLFILMSFLLIVSAVKFLLFEKEDGIDKFGIREIHNTTAGREWFSRWDNGHTRSWNSSSNDPDDPEFITAHKGIGSWSTDGLGILKISGSSPRMYIMDVEQIKNWHNVEITVYTKRILDDNIIYGGIMAYARTNHYIDANTCDDRGYGGRFTYDGMIDFEKETVHHADGYVQTESKNYWSNGMPNDEWIGYKFIVYDIINNTSSNGSVRLELWMDSTDGLNGGNWEIVDEFIDNGNNFGTGSITCKKGINSSLKLTNSDNRTGSETGKPNLAVYFRSDGVGTDGLWYKKASVREIEIN